MSAKRPLEDASTALGSKKPQVSSIQRVFYGRWIHSLGPNASDWVSVEHGLLAIDSQGRIAWTESQKQFSDVDQVQDFVENVKQISKSKVFLSNYRAQD